MNVDLAYTQNISYGQFLYYSLTIFLTRVLEMIPITIGFIITKDSQNKDMVASLALSLTFNLFISGFVIGLRSAISIKCSFFLGQNNPIQFRIHAYRYIIFKLLLSLLSLLIVLNSFRLMVLIGVSKKLAGQVYWIMIRTFPAKFLHNIGFILKELVLAQKHFSILNKVSFVGLIFFLVFEILLMLLLKLQMTGFIIAYTIRYLVEVLYLIYLVYHNTPREYLKLPTLKEIWKGFGSEFLFLLNLSFSNYFHYIAYEIHTVFVSMLHNRTELVAWSLSFQISRYFLYLLLAFKSVLVVFVSGKLGEKDVSGYKRIKKQCLRFSFLSTGLLAIIVIIVAPFLVRLYSNDKKVLETLTFLLWIFAVLSFLKLTGPLYSSLLVIIGKENVQFWISFAILPLFNAVLGYCFCFFVGWGVYGTRFAYFWSLVVYIFFLVLAFKKNEKTFLADINHSQIFEEEIEIL